MSEDFQAPVDVAAEPQVTDQELAHVSQEYVELALKRALADKTGLPIETPTDQLLEAFAGNGIMDDFVIADTERRDTIVAEAVAARNTGQATEEQLEVLAVEHGASLAKKAAEAGATNSDDERGGLSLSVKLVIYLWLILKNLSHRWNLNFMVERQFVDDPELPEFKDKLVVK